MSCESHPEANGDYIQDGAAGPHTTLVADQVTATTLSRAEANIRIWQTYLPADCVKTMVAMGWDEST